MSGTIDAALAYREAGWYVIPLIPPVPGDRESGKKPIDTRWPDLRLSEDDIPLRFADPCLNIGILTGEPSRLVVLDFDDAKLYERWAARHPEAAKSYTVARNNAEPGRCHVYFALAGGQHAPRSMKALGEEVLSTGRQVVAPPSKHYTGGTYCLAGGTLLNWEDELTPESFAAPSATAVETSPNTDALIPPDIQTLIDGGVSEGARNSTAFDLACKFRRSGLDHDSAAFLVRKFNQNCTPPMDEAEVSTILASAYRAEEPGPAGTAPAPWCRVTDEDVYHAIEDSGLGLLVSVLESVTEPPLPLQITLPKAIVLAGCALSQPVEHPIAPAPPGGAVPLANAPPLGRGSDLARFKIITAGAQVCNAWALIVAPSGSGKDIGGLVDMLAHSRGWHIGTSGSAEGLADAYVENGAGLLSVGEFGPWLDPRSWQHKAQAFLTDAFSRGWFHVNLSRRAGGFVRETSYCYPNIIAGVQPAVLAQHATAVSIDGGFLNRFLVTMISDAPRWRPSVRPVSPDNASRALDAYGRACGSLLVPAAYLQPLSDEFVEHEAKHAGHAQRLVNEYGPRLAVMLAVNPSGQDTGGGLVPQITAEHWRRVAILLSWFYAMAEEVLSTIHEDANAAKWELQLERIRAFVAKHAPCSRRLIDTSMSRGTTARMRTALLEELGARGKITRVGYNRYVAS